MKKLLLCIALVILSADVCNAQYLYGTAIAGGAQPSLVRFDPSSNSFTVIRKFFEYYQPTSTKDTLNKRIYFLAPNLSSSDKPDTLITFKLADSSVTTRPIAKGTLAYPQYDNGRLIGISPKGIASYNLTTNQYSLIDTNVKFTNIHSVDFDRTRGRLILMSRSPSNIADTVFVYTVATKALNKYPVGVSATSKEMCYSPTSNKVLFMGIPPNSAANGIYSLSLTTQQFTLEAPVVNNGVPINCATFDEVNNRYFCIILTNSSGSAFNIIEYKLNTSTKIDHMVGSPGLGFSQYFDNQRIPGSGVGIGTVSGDEPFKIYPNPAFSSLNVELDKSGESSIKIYDLTGKTVLSIDNAPARNAINISSLANGKYMISIITKEKIFSRLFDKRN